MLWFYTSPFPVFLEDLTSLFLSFWGYFKTQNAFGFLDMATRFALDHLPNSANEPASARVHVILTFFLKFPIAFCAVHDFLPKKFHSADFQQFLGGRERWHLLPLS